MWLLGGGFELQLIFHRVVSYTVNTFYYNIPTHILYTHVEALVLLQSAEDEEFRGNMLRDVADWSLFAMKMCIDDHKISFKNTQLHVYVHTVHPLFFVVANFIHVSLTLQTYHLQNPTVFVRAASWKEV